MCNSKLLKVKHNLDRITEILEKYINKLGGIVSFETCDDVIHVFKFGLFRRTSFFKQAISSLREPLPPVCLNASTEPGRPDK